MKLFLKAVPRLITTLLLIMVTAKTSYADDALYAKLPPADASFFRFVNATNSDVVITKEGKKISTLKAFKASRYGFVPEANIEFSINDKPLPFDAVAERQVTIVITDDTAAPFKVIDEAKFTNKRKARIKLFNLTETTLTSLKTGDGKHLVINPVENMGFGFRDVNSVKMKFAAFSEASKLAETDTITLKKDKVTSLFAFSNESGITLLSIESNI